MSSKYGEYTTIKTVSKGGFGQIYLAVKEDDKNKNAYILKALKEDEKTINVDNIKLLQKEIDIIFKLNENIKESERNYIPKLFAYDKKILIVMSLLNLDLIMSLILFLMGICFII